MDVQTYKYMIENKDMFTQEAIDGAKSLLESKGLINTNEETTNINNAQNIPSTSNHNESFDNTEIINAIDQNSAD